MKTMNYNQYRKKKNKVARRVVGGLLLLLAICIYESHRSAAPVRPVTGNYGTLSSVVLPKTSVPMPHNEVPMISSGAIRSYARSGHATMPSVSVSGSGSGLSTGSGANYASGYKRHTSSVHSVGGSGSAGGAMASGGSSGVSKGIQYSGGFSSPVLAMSSPTQSALPARRAIGARRVIDNGDGTYTGEYDGEYYNGRWWSEEEEDWMKNPPVGTIKEEGGNVYEWNGSSWVLKGQVSDLGTPIGDTPWLWMLLLVVAYICIIAKRKKSRS